MNESTGILFAIAAMTLWGFEEYFLKKAINGLGTITTLLINTVAGLIITIAVLFIFFEANVTLLYGLDLLFVLIAAIIAMTSYIFFYRALEKQKLSLIASLDESWIIIAIFIGVFILGETLKLFQVLSIIVVLLGVFFISADFAKLKDIKFMPGSGSEALSILFVGLGVPLDKIIISRIGEVNAIFYLSILILPMIFIARWILKNDFVKPTPKLLRIGIYSGIVDSVAFIFFILALMSASVSIVSPIIASSVVVSLILARLYLGERMKPKEIFGSLLVLVGVFMLSI
jgi:uncharacterized membrane protein